MVAKVRIHVKDRADARPATTAARARIPVRARVDARPPRAAAKVKMAAPPAESSSVLSPKYR
jgi:hypothetical protein